MCILPHPFFPLPSGQLLNFLQASTTTLSENMIHSMFACLNRKISDEKVVQQIKDSTAIYRDELTKKIRSPDPLPSKAVKKSVRFADSEHTILGEDEKNPEFMKGGCSEIESGERGRIRVKVKMTKEEAARLLSKCKEGGVLEFKDVARELVALPVNRVSVVSTGTEPTMTL